MSGETATLWLLWLAAVPITVYVTVLSVTTPWWRTWTGWALFMFAAGYGLLVDLSLAYRVFGADYHGRDLARLVAFSVSMIGGWLKCLDLLHDKATAWRRTRSSALD